MISKKVYIASDAFVAFMDRAHVKHVQAAAYFRYFAQENYQIYSTIVSINETYTTSYNTISPSLARDFLRVLALSSVNVIYPEAADMKTSIRTLETSNSVDMTFAKALMAAVCNKKSIPQIATFEYLHALFGLQLFYLPM
ncbi:MAG: type II toxin-antitoxin system VapC family toxin [Candidatus Levyibacteriota bacterium]